MNVGMYNQREDVGQQRENRVFPTLFGQSQIKNGFGPVYAIPSIPWQHDNGQNVGSNYWQQWGGHPHVVMHCGKYYPVGYRYYG